MSKMQSAYGKTRRHTSSASKRLLTRSQRQQVKKIIKDATDKNYYVHDSVTTPVEYSQTYQDLNITASIVQGDGVGQRIGDKLRITGLQGFLRSYIENGGAAADLNAPRYMLIQWHPDNAVETPSAAKLFENSATFYLSDFIKSPAARSKFTVLFDTGFQNLQWDVKRQIMKSFYVKSNKIRAIQFNDDAATGKNHIYEVWHDIVSAGAKNAQLQHMISVRYLEN